MPKILELRLIGDAEDVEEFVRGLRAANILGSDSVNYPAKNGKVRRYLDVVIPSKRPVNS